MSRVTTHRDYMYTVYPHIDGHSDRNGHTLFDVLRSLIKFLTKQSNIHSPLHNYEETPNCDHHY